MHRETQTPQRESAMFEKLKSIIQAKAKQMRKFEHTTDIMDGTKTVQWIGPYGSLSLMCSDSPARIARVKSKELSIPTLAEALQKLMHDNSVRYQDFTPQFITRLSIILPHLRELTAQANLQEGEFELELDQSSFGCGINMVSGLCRRMEGKPVGYFVTYNHYIMNVTTTTTLSTGPTMGKGLVLLRKLVAACKDIHAYTDYVVEPVLDHTGNPAMLRNPAIANALFAEQLCSTMLDDVEVILAMIEEKQDLVISRFKELTKVMLPKYGQEASKRFEARLMGS